MDNWGDPWADNAETTTSPTENKVTSPSYTPAPALLNGFLDDAGWGNEDDDFGDWSAAPANDPEASGSRAQSRMTEPFPRPDSKFSQQDTRWDTQEHSSQHALPPEDDWASVKWDAQRDTEHVVSESSDSSTTIPANENGGNVSIETAVQSLPDDDSFARASTSTSTTSHNDVPAESPNTSYEEERGSGKAPSMENVVDEVDSSNASHFEGSASHLEAIISGRADDHTQFKAQASKEEATSGLGALHASAKDYAESLSEATRNDVQDFHLASADTGSAAAPGAYVIDMGLIEDLLPPTERSEELGDPLDDPIYSTSGRKAWYRLTRKHTMREFNHGSDDDNYVRVNWAISHIRLKVNDIVGRWAQEDRISGTGPGARASFYWDTPAPTGKEPGFMHARQKSSISTISEAVPSESNTLPFSMSTPAAFNWSSPTASVNPWNKPSPGPDSSFSTIGSRSTGSTIVQRLESQAISVDFILPQPDQERHSQPLAAADVDSSNATLIAPPTANTVTSHCDTWTTHNDSDATSKPERDYVHEPVDDDEWGEMVSTTVESISSPTESPTQDQMQHDVLSSISTNSPQAAKVAAAHDQSQGAIPAAPVVRLKSTISPTSALFQVSSFVPLNVERGPIGPGILKPVNRSASATRKETDTTSPVESKQEVAPPLFENSSKHDLSAGASQSQSLVADMFPKESLAPASAITPSLESHNLNAPLASPIEVAPAQSSVDPWADADFSFFESAPSASPGTLPEYTSSPFVPPGNMKEAAGAAQTVKPFARPPPRNATPPPLQPLTGATNLAQRRKADEDQIIERILSGLPDLSYMLR